MYLRAQEKRRPSCSATKRRKPGHVLLAIRTEGGGKETGRTIPYRGFLLSNLGITKLQKKWRGV